MPTIRRLVVIVLFDRVDLLDVTGPAEVFSLLQREMDEPTGYEVVLAAQSRAPVRTSAGVQVLPDATFAQVLRRRIDTLVVPGAVDVDAQRGVRAVVAPSLAGWVRRLARRTRRVTSVCVGAHVLAAAGLLDGRRATTHWSTARQLALEHPAVHVDPDPIYIRDGNIWTGAGLTACLDLALALVAEDVGERLAQCVARQLVMYLKRPGGQSQFSVALDPAPTSRRMETLRQYVMTHAARPITIATLAAQVHVGERQLTRIFRAELGITPAAYVESIRVDRARDRLETSDEPLDRIARACGLRTPDTLARAFRRRFGMTPAAYRSRFRTH